MSADAANQAKPKYRRPGWWLTGLFWLVLVAALATASLLGYWGREHWKLDAFAHFRLQYFSLTALLSLLLLWRRRWLLLLLAVAVLLLNGWEIFHWPRNPGLWREPPLKAVSINVYSGNRELDRTVAFLREEQPDFVSLIEITGEWRPALDALRDLYPYQDINIWGDNFGSALLSSHPMTDESFRYVAAGSQIREVQTPAGNFLLMLMHPLSPMNGKAWNWRNAAFKSVASFIETTDKPILLLGDLNCTPWSPIFQDFVAASGLHPPDARVLPRRTWPADKPWLWIPIDHFLLSPELTALAEWVGPDVGSDHYPIVLIFAFSAEN